MSASDQLFNGVRAVAVGVTDIERAIEFFTKTLGFSILMDAQLDEALRWIEVAPKGSSTSIALPTAGGPPVGIDTGIRFSVTDARAAHAHLTSAGINAGEVLDFGGAPPMFAFNDPDGNSYYAVEASD